MAEIVKPETIEERGQEQSEDAPLAVDVETDDLMSPSSARTRANPVARYCEAKCAVARTIRS